MKGKTCFYDVEELDGDIRISLKGEMDHHNAVGVRGEIDRLIYSERPKTLMLDLSEMGFMDSSGLGFIMGRYALMEKLGGTLILENPNERIVKIFELAGLQRIVRVENSKKEKTK